VVLERATAVLREAAEQAKHLSDEEFVPRVKDAYATARPRVESGIKSSRDVAGRIGKQVAPAVAGALSSAKLADLAKDPRVTKAVDAYRKATGKPAPIPVKTGPSAGSVVAIVIGVVAAAGVGYALWQTFLADDELWIAEDADVELPNT
jgi:hypothetical protein